MTRYFDGVMKSNEVAGEVSYTIPRDQVDKFKKFFEKLDTSLDKLDLKSYGVSMTSLEEVFLNINEEMSPERFIREKKK